jgi:hypothetical protein
MRCRKVRPCGIAVPPHHKVYHDVNHKGTITARQRYSHVITLMDGLRQ